MSDNRDWSEFQKLTAKLPPRPMLIKALELFNGFTGFAVDLGCGSGIDTIKLINSGWKVCAIDAVMDCYENMLMKFMQMDLRQQIL